MSLWQRKNIHKRHILWLNLFGICLFLHSTVLVWVFFVYNNDSYDISLSLNKNIDYSSPILFVPLSSHITTTTQTSPPEKNNVTITPSINKESIQPKKVMPTEKVAPTTLATQKKETPVQEKKIEAPNKTENTIKKEEPQKKESVVEQKPTTNTTKQAQNKIPHASEKQMAPAIKENAQISHNYKEVEALRRNALLQKELVSNWKPPVGMPENTSCEVSFFVDKQGGVKNIVMTKSSGIMMYDISARQALFSMKMPQWTHGKTITINFT